MSFPSRSQAPLGGAVRNCLTERETEATEAVCLAGVSRVARSKKRKGMFSFAGFNGKMPSLLPF